MPSRIAFFYQIYFPLPVPFFQLFLSVKCRVNILSLFIVDQIMNTVFFCKTIC